jgi:hypothetical protein
VALIAAPFAALVPGQDIDIQAQVSAGSGALAPSGTVTFFDDAMSLGSARNLEYGCAGKWCA